MEQSEEFVLKLHQHGAIETAISYSVVTENERGAWAQTKEKNCTLILGWKI